MKYIKRTFAALRYPKASEERTNLNLSWLTSEYMPSHRYGLVEDDGTTTPFTFKTKAEAVARIHEATGNDANREMGLPEGEDWGDK